MGTGSETVAEGGHERAEIRWPVESGVVYARHVQALVGVGDDVAESRRFGQSPGQLDADHLGIPQSREGVRVT